MTCQFDDVPLGCNFTSVSRPYCMYMRTEDCDRGNAVRICVCDDDTDVSGRFSRFSAHEKVYCTPIFPFPVGCKRPYRV